MIALFAIGALVVASASASAVAPGMELRVMAFDTRPGAVAETDLDLSLARANGPVSMLVPAGYVVDLGRRPGSVVGTATVTAGGLRWSALLLATTGATWSAGSLEVAAAADRLTFTPPPGTTEVDLHLEGVLTNPPAATVAVWRATSGGIEARSLVPLPQRLDLRAVSPHGVVTLRGRLVAAGRARPGVNVHVALAPGDDLSKAREIGVAHTRPDGRFALSYATPAGRLTALAYVNDYVASCAAPCVSETVAPPPPEVVAVAPLRQGFSERRLG